MERRIIDRFAKTCDKILVGCGMLHDVEFEEFLKNLLESSEGQVYPKDEEVY